MLRIASHKHGADGGILQNRRSAADRKRTVDDVRRRDAAIDIAFHLAVAEKKLPALGQGGVLSGAGIQHGLLSVDAPRNGGIFHAQRIIFNDGAA